jgi:hypothetical protein
MEFFRSMGTDRSVRRLPRRRNLPESKLAKVTVWAIPAAAPAIRSCPHVRPRAACQALLLEHGHAPGERTDHAVGFANDVNATGRDFSWTGATTPRN